MIKERIESISTDNKTVIVNRINKSIEVVFRKQNRPYCTIHLNSCQQSLIDGLIKQFLKNGEVPNNVGWMV